MEAHIATLCIVGLSFLGPLFISKIKEQKIQRLIMLASGAIFVTGLLLAKESIHIGGGLVMLICVAGGFLFMTILQRIIPETHHHHHPVSCPEGNVSKHGIKMLIGGSIHNITDGIIIAITFSHSTTVGLVTAASIGLHELFLDTSQFLVLKDANFSTRKALLWTFITALTIFVGLGIGFQTTNNTLLQAVLLSVSSGIFLQIALVDFAPHKIVFNLRRAENRKPAMFFIVGIVIISGINILTPHSHNHPSDCNTNQPPETKTRMFGMPPDLEHVHDH